MKTFTRERIRLECDVVSQDYMLDQITGQSPSMWRGTDLALEVGFFYQGELIDIGPYASITAEVRDEATRSSTILATKTVPAADLFTALSAPDWESGTKQHAVFTWTSEETRWDLQSQLQRNFWLVIHAITNDSPPRRVTLGATLLTVQEDGAGEPGNSPLPGNPLFLTAAQTQALIGQVIRPTNAPGQTILLKSPNGQWGRLIGVNDQGAATDDIVTL